MTIRPTPQPRPLVDDARPGLPTIPRQTAPAPDEILFNGPAGGGLFSTTRGELDDRFFDDSAGRS